MASKKRPSKSNRPRPADLDTPSKFHGWIEVKHPEKGDLIKDTNPIMVVIRSITFGNLPDHSENEIFLVVSAETDGDKQVVGSLKVDLLKYVKDKAPLNIQDLVILSAPVRNHLTLRCTIEELDARSVDRTKALLNALLGIAKDLVTGPAPLLNGLPTLLSALLAFNEDDQILLLNHSFYTAGAKVDEARLLRAGTYTFTKLLSKPPDAGKPGAPKMPRPAETPQVVMEVEVIARA